MNVLLKRGIIPIINENDTVTVNRLKFGDNDTLSAKVAGLIDADLLTILSDIDGLYDANPRKTPDAALVREVNEITPEIEASAGDAGSEVGTGGMKSKLDAFKITMASGIKGFLGRADTPGLLHEAISGTAKGTYFIPNADSHTLNHKEQWIAFNSGPEGDIVVHNESKEFIIDRKKSLYPSSIYEINGRFSNGSVVRILDQEGEEIGLGVVNFSSSQLRKWKKDTNQETAASSQAVVDREAFVCHLELSVPL